MDLLTVFFIAIGLSMDALAVGLSFSLLAVNIIVPVLVIGLVTWLLSRLEHLQGG